MRAEKHQFANGPHTHHCAVRTKGIWMNKTPELSNVRMTLHFGK